MIFAPDTYDHDGNFKTSIEQATYQLACLKKMGVNDARWIPMYNHLSDKNRDEADDELFFWAITQRPHELKHSTTFFKTKRKEDQRHVDFKIRSLLQ